MNVEFIKKESKKWWLQSIRSTAEYWTFLNKNIGRAHHIVPILRYNFVSGNNRISLIKKYITRKNNIHPSFYMIGNYRYYLTCRYYSYKNEYRFEKQKKVETVGPHPVGH